MIPSQQERHSVPSLQANFEYLENYEKTTQIKKKGKIQIRKRICNIKSCLSFDHRLEDPVFCKSHRMISSMKIQKYERDRSVN